MLEEEKAAVETERKRLEQLAAFDDAKLAGRFSSDFDSMNAFRLLYTAPTQISSLGSSRQNLLKALRLSELEASTSSKRAKKRFAEAFASRNAASRLRQFDSPCQPTICNDMFLLDSNHMSLPQPLNASNSSFGSAVVVGTQSGDVLMYWSLSTPSQPDNVGFKHIWSHAFRNEGGISSVRASPNESLILSATCWGGDGIPGTLRLMGLNGVVKSTHKLRRGSLWCHEWQPNRTNEIVALGTESSALMIHLPTQKITKIFTGKSDVFCQQFDRAGRLLFNGTRDGKVKTYDTRQSPKSIPDSGSHSATLQHKQSISCMWLLRDENKLLCASADGVIQLWDRRICKSLRTWSFPNKYALTKFALDPEERFISVACSDRKLRVWDLSYHYNDDSPPFIEANIPTTQSSSTTFSSGGVCCQNWIPTDGDATFSPQAIFFSNISLFSVPILS